MYSFQRYHRFPLCLKASNVAWYSSLANFNGVFAVNKPSGPSSAVVVGRIKRAVNNSKLILGSKVNASLNKSNDQIKFSGQSGQPPWEKKKNVGLKVGHGGTLDPLASGVMVIGVGTGTRELTKYLTNCTKAYEAVAMFGASTTTYDSMGQVLEHGPTDHLAIEAIQDAIDTKLSGEILQLPPIYSALKMDGKPLYEYARNGIPLPKQIEPRRVTIHSFKIMDKDLNWNQTEYKLPETEADAEEKELIFKQNQEVLRQLDSKERSKLSGISQPNNSQSVDLKNKKYPTLTFQFSVSSGTYIRSIIHDLAKSVGTTAHLTKLVRLQQGPFHLGKNVFDLDDILEASQGDSEWVPLVESAIRKGPHFDFDASHQLKV